MVRSEVVIGAVHVPNEESNVKFAAHVKQLVASGPEHVAHPIKQRSQ
jgi:hypothetical protein